jgi:hypothetical protein
LLTEYANEIVTANGSPSGTATTTTVTAMINCFTRAPRSCLADHSVYPSTPLKAYFLTLKLMIIATKVAIATYRPNLPI